MAGIAMTSFVPVLSDLVLRQRYGRSERRQAQRLGQLRGDILRHRCNAVGARRDDCSGNKARQSKQNAIRGDFGFQRMLGHMMGSVPNI